MPSNRFICHNCSREYTNYDFSDFVWNLFCSWTCLHTWCRKKMPPPMKAQKTEAIET